MKLTVTLFISFFCFLASAQISTSSAKDYFEQGAFEKALILYQKLLNKQRGNSYYFFRVIECHQQLSQYKAAQKEIEIQIKRSRNPQNLVELGYNYQLQNQLTQADLYYKKAVQSIEIQPNYVYAVALRFEAHSLIDYAIEVYEIGLKTNPNDAFYYQLAELYATQKNIEKMMERYLDYVETNPPYISQVMRLLSEYISEDASQPYNQLFKKVLLKKLQTKPNPCSKRQRRVNSKNI